MYDRVCLFGSEMHVSELPFPQVLLKARYVVGVQGALKIDALLTVIEEYVPAYLLVCAPLDDSP
jgi:hypothetical protein